MFSPIHVALFIVLALGLYRLSKIGKRPPGCPPGPPTLPLIGNLHKIPTNFVHLKFEEWAKQYGPIYSLMMGTEVWIVLSEPKVVKDLLDKRGAIYSSRPDMYLANLVSGNNRMLLMKYDVKWREIRRIVHETININASKAYMPYLKLESIAMLKDLLEKPERFADHIRRYTYSFATQMVYGFRTPNIDNPDLKRLFHNFEKFSEVAGSTEAALLDMYPLLRRLPDWAVPMKQHAKELHKKERNLYMDLWEGFKKRPKDGTAKQSFCHRLLQAQQERGFSDESASYMSGSILEAASDTTFATLLAWVLYMLLYPEEMKIAQKEVDQVCGDRLPTLEDMPELPRICQCIKETLRLGPTDPLGVPHALTKDDNYNGYKLPKGARVICNVRTIHMDEKNYSNPHDFNPARYEDDSQTASQAALNPDPSKRDHYTFGTGRRLCQGMHIAESSMRLFAAQVLWGFSVEKAINADGEEIVPNREMWTEGLFVQPESFPAKIKPRSEERAKAILAEWKKMEKKLDENSQWKEIPEVISG